MISFMCVQAVLQVFHGHLIGSSLMIKLPYFLRHLTFI